ncbi:unnamed protein product [Moneuplotes crassus]|uniref:Uncharacterized protein n=1 Tax=Euplotes crassus TaxID=5936 RepID=A0AAD1Y3I6_EUPCR|nr:unnamed protein product [Moneuplotes crassus]
MYAANPIDGYGGYINEEFGKLMERNKRAASVIQRPKQESQGLKEKHHSQTLTPSRIRPKNVSNPYNTPFVPQRSRSRGMLSSLKMPVPRPNPMIFENHYPFHKSSKSPGKEEGWIPGTRVEPKTRNAAYQEFQQLKTITVADEEHKTRKKDLAELTKVWLNQQMRDNAQIKKINQGTEEANQGFSRKLAQGKDFSRRANKITYEGKRNNSYDNLKLSNTLKLGKTLKDHWKDPATNYFKKSILEKQRTDVLSNSKNAKTIDCEDYQDETTFMYPLCNSPTRKEYYREVMKDHKEVLLAQMQNNYHNRKQEQRNQRIKGYQGIPISEIYNNDLDRMKKQFHKYLTKEKAIQHKIKVEDFMGDPMKKRNQISEKEFVQRKNQQFRPIEHQHESYSKDDSKASGFKYTPYNPIQQLPDANPRKVRLKSPAPLKQSLLNLKKMSNNNFSRNPRAQASRTIEQVPVKSIADLKEASHPSRFKQMSRNHQAQDLGGAQMRHSLATQTTTPKILQSQLPRKNSFKTPKNPHKAHNTQNIMATVNPEVAHKSILELNTGPANNMNYILHFPQ